MSTGYELQGRTAQKQRTRAALVAAARDLVAAGETPTVEAAADAAAVSRTTAYRYFPNQRALLAAAHPETAATSLLPADPPADPKARLVLVLDAMVASLLENESQQRTMLRLSLDLTGDASELPLRQGRGIGWITEALEPLRARLGAKRLRELVFGIRSATGIESLVWLVDVAGVSRADAVRLMRRTAMALYHDAVG